MSYNCSNIGMINTATFYFIYVLFRYSWYTILVLGVQWSDLAFA